MAAPAVITTRNLSGTWTLNKTHSDSLDNILALQGVSWIIRKAIGAVTVTLHVTQYTDANGVEHVDVENVITGGIKSLEPRVLDNSERHDKDDVFGHIIRRSTRVKPFEITHEYLKGNCDEPAAEATGVLRLITSSDTSKTKNAWGIEQIWGFEIVNGERRSTERIHFVGPKGEIIEGRLVYDFVKST